jgi:hypothetical protein
MMTPFLASHGPIIVDVILWGPAAHTNVRLALDTGATRTLIRDDALALIGVDSRSASMRAQVTMGNSVQFVRLVEVTRVEALGKTRDQLLVIAHTLPSSAGVDGVLGLDFLRLRRLTIDFRRGQIRLV